MNTLQVKNPRAGKKTNLRKQRLDFGKELRKKTLGPCQTVVAKMVGRRLAKQYKETWRRYNNLHEQFQLTWRDWPKFVQQWKRFGEDKTRWRQKGVKASDLRSAIFAEGYVYGREIECGNLNQDFRYCARQLFDVLNADYGPKPGLPTTQQVEKHNTAQLVGMWMCLVKVDGMPGSWPYLVSMRTHEKTGRIQYSVNGKKWSEWGKDANDVLTSMPVTISGTPAPWPKTATPTPAASTVTGTP
jgi:hypothetical protein